MKIIILAGGSGTRLWPLSREGCPKQFIKLLNSETSLFQDTLTRSIMLVDLRDIFIVTNKKYQKLVREQIKELGLSYNKTNILVEPEAKNTLPAIYYAVVRACKNEDDTIVVFPSDHKIKQEMKLIDVIKSSIKLSNDNIVTFGIKPDKPNVGYGYILTGRKKLNGYIVKDFKEKPDLQTAIEYVKDGYLWNSGMLMFHSKLLKNETKKYAIHIYKAFEEGKDEVECFAKIKEGISIDYGIMEKTLKAAVVPVKIGWSDLGSFDSFYDVFEKDNKNNIAYNNEILIESNNNLILSAKNKEVVIVGIDDLIVVDHNDALLICKKKESSKVKDVVSMLKKVNVNVT